MNEDLHIRTMTAEDIAAAMELKELMGWNQLPRDWERFLEWEPQGCFVAECGGRLVGTTTAISYEDKFGWVGMVMVHPQMRRRGIGRALMSACIEYLERRVACIRLDATPMGKLLYEKLGFVEEYELHRWQGIAAGRGASDVVPISEEVLEAVKQFDRPIFGADRSRVLHRLASEAEVGKWVAMEGEVIQGYVMVRPGAHAWYVGPLVCRGPQWAEQLLSRALQEVAGQPVLIDVCSANAEAVELIKSLRFQPQRKFTRMYRGNNAWPGLPEYVYCPAGAEIG